MIIVSSAVVGFVGDLLLQSIVTPENDYGLSSYFRQHGKLESAFIASGMMAILNLAYTIVDPSVNTIGFIAYGGVLDVVFRRYHPTIMPSLDGYYRAMTPAMSIVWGMIPQLLVLAVN